MSDPLITGWEAIAGILIFLTLTIWGVCSISKSYYEQGQQDAVERLCRYRRMQWRRMVDAYPWATDLYEYWK